MPLKRQVRQCDVCYDQSALGASKLHIFTAIQPEAHAIRPVLPPWAELTVIGIRARHLPQKIEPKAIVMAGFAGALDPALKLGEIVHDDPPGVIFTSKQLVATPEDKANLFLRTRARAVDMENGIVRDFAQRFGVSFYGLRAISDTASEAIDPLVLECIDDVGRVRPGEMAKAILKKPSLVKTFNRLRINSGIAGRALAIAVKTFLDENRSLFD